MSKHVIEPIRCDQCPTSSCATSWIWVSHKLKVIWLENPKVASTSIKTLLGVQPKGAVQGNLSNPYEFKRLPLPRDQILNLRHYFIFGFCRNPWDRMVSMWKNFTTGPSRQMLLTKHWKVDDPQQLTFESFIKLLDKNQPRVNHHWVPQNMFLPADKIEIDFIGRIEHFDEDWKTIAEMTGMKDETCHEYSTEHDHYSTYYNADTLAIVSRLYEKDISLFDYTFEQEEYHE